MAGDEPLTTVGQNRKEPTNGLNEAKMDLKWAWMIKQSEKYILLL
jgi:hypothetical protein